MAHRRININMRCIEMLTGASNKAAKQGLTLTWDVLKFEKMKKVACGANGLTLTWDVLKWQYILDEEIWRGRLTLTWDVLKYRQINIIGHTDWININMRCIEIVKVDWGSFASVGLTLTWDVLKYASGGGSGSSGDSD